MTPPPAIHMVKPNGLWSRPSPFSETGVRPNSPPQIDQGVVEEPPPLEVGQEAGDRLVDLLRLLADLLADVRMVVPAAVDDLDHPDAVLDQPTGQQAGVGELPLRRRARGWLASSLRMSKTSGAAACIRKAVSIERIRASRSGVVARGRRGGRRSPGGGIRAGAPGGPGRALGFRRWRIIWSGLSACPSRSASPGARRGGSRSGPTR